MKLFVLPAMAGCAVLSALNLFDHHAIEAQGGPQDKPQKQLKAMADAIAKMKKYTAPGKNHKILERFVGEWQTETRVFMAGKPTKPEVGRSKVTWLMPGRWLQMRGTGALMGRKLETFALFGYDNFKQSFVTTSVSNMDTAMLRTEGDMDPDGKALLTYGTLDEYLTGEHDKMVKSVWHFVSPDKIVWEIHDLPIGKKHTKVMEIVMTRSK